MDEIRQGYGIQEWPADGSKYEGEFLNGLKHGTGRYTWTNGEYYEGSFFKDYRHGEGLYSWPSGYKFSGKFYLNKKEGYGMKQFPDGTTFQGLYHAHQKFGPGVLTYPDGRQDVGMWHREHLIRLCTSLEGGFSLRSFPEYAAYMGPSVSMDSLIQPSNVSEMRPENRVVPKLETDPLRSPYPDLMSDESFIRPPGLEFYSTDGDHLPLPPGFREELDRCFFGELWEPGLDRDPALTSTLSLQPRMQAHIHRHSRETVRVGWDVSAVLSLSRAEFGPKGPLELSSEMLIQQATMGDQQAVNQILRTRSVSPDVGDAHGHTPLIAATVNCHNDVIHLLLDMGADIDKLNCEDMNALAVCHVLYYSFQTLHTTVAESKALSHLLTTPRGPTPHSPRANSPQSSPKSDREMDEQGNTPEKSSHDDNEQGKVEPAGEKVHNLQVLDGHILVGSVTWPEGGARAAGVSSQRFCAMVDESKDVAAFDSARSLDNFLIPVTEDMMQSAAEALSRIRVPQRTDSQETVRKMAAMKTEHRARWNTLRLLLQRGADPNASRVPMPVLFLAIKASHTEAVRTLLQCGARTDMPLPPEWKGLYPLHVAAGLPGPEGPRITELLLHAITDADAQAQDHEDVYELDKHGTAPKSRGPSSQNSSSSREAPAEGGRTALHVACQRDSDYTNASKVVSLLLSHSASTHLLWSGHSPLSLAIASGDDMAVEELLRGGADPNLPLSRGVGSALCALSNINYHSTRYPHNFAELFTMLVKAGADISMPVMVGEGHRRALGTAVDYAHHTFNQDLRIAHTAYHALSWREREMYNAREKLLSTMGNLMRQQATARMETERLEREECPTMSASSKERFVYMGGGAKPLKVRISRDTVASQETENGSSKVPADSIEVEQRNFKPESKEPAGRKNLRMCYQCGRSAFFVLTPCSRCHQVFYCSTTCKVKAWNQRHKDECIRVPASARPTLWPTNKKENYSFC